MLHRFNTCAVGILRQLRAIERSAHELKRLRSNAYGPEIERNAYDRSHEGLRSTVTPAIERTHVTWQHISFVYK